MTHHGMLELRGLDAPRSKYYERGKFGRLFPNLPPLAGHVDSLREAMREVGKSGGIMDGTNNNPDNLDVFAGFTFLGQFIDHDVTFDPTSQLEQQVDPEAIQNFRTPLLELDNVYGSGPGASPHLYDNTPANRGKLLIDSGFDHDLPRNSQGTAVLGDPRNDENVIVSQLHLAFLKFHNRAIDFVKADGVTPPAEVFAKAQRLVRWHYQWIVVNEFLPHICGRDVVEDTLEIGRCFYDWRNEPFIPVEFAVAAYRFGHSQVRPGYRINDTFAAAIFGQPGDPNDLSSGRRLPVERKMDWKNFFQTQASTPQASKLIDTKLSAPLLRLPFIPPGNSNDPMSLAERNLLRSITFSLPSGQSVARTMAIKKCWKKVKLKDVQPLTPAELKSLKGIGNNLKLDHETPLWFYILQEAEARRGGKSLGPVGGRIVAEVFLGLLDGDRMSYRRVNPNWTPEFTRANKDDFTMVDLLKFAGVA